jgi:monofunctional glycosyltransferase
MKKLHKLLRILLAAALLAAFAAAESVTVQGYRMYRQALAQTPLSVRIAEVRAQPHYTTLDELPSIYTDAVISVEDRRFYTHCGIDPAAIARAFAKDIAAGSLAEGGSTITQQVAKNLYFTQEKRFSRKVAEVFMAFALERSCTKDEILELYVNSIYYGSGYYNIYDAAEGYFQKTPAEMTDSECTLLAGLPNAPSAYSPEASQTLAVQRQAQVLRAMVRCLRLTQAQADAILAQSSQTAESAAESAGA